MSIVTEKDNVQVSGKASGLGVTLIKKKIAEKKAIDQYLRGEITLQELYARGIRFVQPV